jgi:Putative prokaryotic signal transducing protein
MGSRLILKTWDDTEAELIRGLLESYGIPCSVISDITHTVVPLTVDGLGEIRVSVPEEAVGEALRILREHQVTGSNSDLGNERTDGGGGEEESD